MFIAHLPAGYLATRPLRTGAAALMVGAVLPDLDLFWFIFWDHGTVHHHTYLTHRPAVWLLGLLALWRITWARCLCGGALLHLALDSVNGAINWGWPFADISAPLVGVPATYDHWTLSFLLHWTFALELAICILAGWVWIRKSPER